MNVRLRMYQVLLFKCRRHLCKGSMGRFQSVYDRKFASHEGDLEFISRFYPCEGGFARVVNLYGPCRWNRRVSICTRSENCISLRWFRIYSTFLPVWRGFTGCRSVWSVQTEWAAFNLYTIGKLHLIKVNIFDILFLRGFHGLSIRTVRTDGMGLFQSVHDRKIASH